MGWFPKTESIANFFRQQERPPRLHRCCARRRLRDPGFARALDASLRENRLHESSRVQGLHRRSTAAWMHGRGPCFCKKQNILNLRGPNCCGEEVGVSMTGPFFYQVVSAFCYFWASPPRTAFSFCLSYLRLTRPSAAPWNGTSWGSPRMRRRWRSTARRWARWRTAGGKLSRSSCRRRR